MRLEGCPWSYASLEVDLVREEVEGPRAVPQHTSQALYPAHLLADDAAALSNPELEEYSAAFAAPLTLRPKKLGTSARWGEQLHLGRAAENWSC